MSTSNPDVTSPETQPQADQPQADQSQADARAQETQAQVDQRDERIRQLEAQLRASQGGPRVDPNAEDRPWNVAAQNGKDENLRDVAPLPYRGPGAVLHHFPHLTGGSGGPQNGPYVRALAELLAELGYATNGVIRGEVQHYDNSLAADVARFKMDHDVRENIDAYHGHPDPAEEIAKNLVGPYTVQALLEKVAGKRGQDIASLIGQVEYDIARHQR